MSWEEEELTYSPRLRFVLTDHERRLFICERSYFLGSVDDFGALTGPEPLEKLVQTYAPHLGNNSFEKYTRFLAWEVSVK